MYTLHYVMVQEVPQILDVLLGSKCVNLFSIRCIIIVKVPLPSTLLQTF